jgi:hypothetical protein
MGQPAGGQLTMPLLAETLLLVALAWLIGLGIGKLLFGRAKKEGFL